MQRLTKCPACAQADVPRRRERNGMKTWCSRVKVCVPCAADAARGRRNLASTRVPAHAANPPARRERVGAGGRGLQRRRLRRRAQPQQKPWARQPAPAQPTPRSTSRPANSTTRRRCICAHPHARVCRRPPSLSRWLHRQPAPPPLGHAHSHANAHADVRQHRAIARGPPQAP